MELGPFINDLADRIGATGWFSSLFDSPIYTALMMTAIVILIFYFAQIGARDRFAFRANTTIKVFLSLLAIMFIYHRRFKKCQERNARVSGIVGGLEHPPIIPPSETVAVVPSVYMQA